MIPSLLGEGGRKSSLPHLIFVSLLSCSNRYFLVRFVAAATLFTLHIIYLLREPHN